MNQYSKTEDLEWSKIRRFINDGKSQCHKVISPEEQSNRK